MDLPTRIGWPSTTKIKLLLNSGQLKNRKVTVEYIVQDEYIYGKLVVLSKGKMILRKNLMYTQIHRVPSTAPILQFNKYVTLKWGYLSINSMPFLTSQIRKIKFSSIERTNSRGNKMILQVVKSVIEQYQARGFKVTGHKPTKNSSA